LYNKNKIKKEVIIMGKYNKDTNKPNPPKEDNRKKNEDKRSHGEDVTKETHRKNETGGYGKRNW
jgi:hypothetical protein